MNRTVRRVAGAAACSLALSAVATAAHAEGQTHEDPRGDVRTKLPGRAEPAQQRRVVDIVRVSNTYSQDTLRLAVTTTHLPPSNYQVVWRIRAVGDGSTWTTTFDHAQGQESAQIIDETITPCLEGVEARSMQEEATVVVRVPASCIDDSDVVRVATRTYRVSGDALLRVDDGWATGYTQGDPSPRGPRLRRTRAEG